MNGTHPVTLAITPVKITHVTITDDTLASFSSKGSYASVH